MLLVVGGDEDPNIRSLISRLRARRTTYRALLVGSESHPRITWDLAADRLILNGRSIRPTAAFIRHDVFTNMSDERAATAYRAYSWYSTLASWVAAHADIRCFNRHAGGELQKPHQLHLAAQEGLDVPATWITNDVRLLRARLRTRDLVVKPVNGGDYCQRLAPLLPQIPDVRGAAASPAIVQEQLVPPDIRVFRVGKRYFTFEIESDGLDYRDASFSRVTVSTAVSRRLQQKIGRVSKKMGLDYSATDLKWSDERRRLVFLEVNSAPMFAAFDAAGDGALCDAFIDHLVG